MAALFIAGLLYCGSILLRTNRFYRFLKNGQRGWSGHLHRVDRTLGYAPVPNSRGFEIIPETTPIPVRYDSHGFRVPAGEASDSSDSHPLILALGCSFTYGAANVAEDTYPFLVGKAVGGTLRNAGVSGYGLAQMVLLARKLIPELRPDVVLVQDSPWLIERAVSPFAPNYFGRLPTPYFVEAPKLEIHPPVFGSPVFDLPIEDFRSTKATVVDFTSFLGRVGFPLYVHDDVHMLLYAGARSLRAIPAPTRNEQLAERRAFEDIGRVARDNGATLVVVGLGNDARPVTVDRRLLPEGCLFVDAQAALLERLPALANDDAYLREFGLWAGDPSRLIDNHPNVRAHRIIADAIAGALEQWGAVHPAAGSITPR